MKRLFFLFLCFVFTLREEPDDISARWYVQHPDIVNVPLKLELISATLFAALYLF